MSRYTDEYKADAIAQLKKDGYPDSEGSLAKIRASLVKDYGYAPVINTLKRWFDEHDSSDDQLTDKQKVFVNEYLKCWNATEAARKAGYSENSIRAIAHETLTKPYIQEMIQQRLEEMKMGADESLTLLAKMARSSMEDFVDIGEMEVDEDGNEYAPMPTPNFVKAQALGKMDMVKKMTWSKGRFSFELYDKQTAVNTVAKHHGLLKDHIQIDIKLVIEVVDALKQLGQDPVKVFNEIIARAAATRDAN